MPAIRTSVVGAGMALQMLHWPSMACQSDLFTLHSVMDRSGRGKVKEVCGQGVKVVHDYEGVVSDPDVELVVVASPNNTHHAYVKRALGTGKHVLVEKPITRTAAEAQELADLANSKGLILTVYQNRRWDSDFLTVRKLLNDGQLGELIEFTSSYDRYRPIPNIDPSKSPSWKESPDQGNETIYNLGSHIIDQAYVLFGMPEKLSCRIWDMRGTGLAEAFHMDLFYPASHGQRAFTVTLRASIVSAVPQQVRFQIKGSKGSYIKYGTDPQERQTPELGRTGVKGPDYGKEVEDKWGELAVARRETEDTEWDVRRLEPVPGDWPALYANVHQAIALRDAAKLAVQPEEFVQVIKLIELGIQSSREERVVYL